MSLQSRYAASFSVLTMILLAGCGGGQGPSAGLPSGSNVGTMGVQPLNHNRQGCENGNLDVRPCRITFDSNNPGPTMVTVTDQGNHGTIKEHDNCASRNIATITRDSNHLYTVAAGTSTGVCAADFTDGEGGGNGDHLRIDNLL